MISNSRQPLDFDLGETADMIRDTVRGFADAEIAPISIGAGAFTATGAVVTRDVEPGQTVAGVPAKPFQRRERQ